MALESPTRMATQQLVAWLDDAHAMERGLVPILRNQVSHFERMPHVAARLLEHIEETEAHADRVRRCLLLLDANPSTVKSSMSSVMGTIEGASTALFADQVVKDALADYGAEQFEVGCYTALLTAATQLGYADVAELCAQNLEEDQAMADWILDELPALVEQYASER
jgi:ferritin-like metal-binding protein YciE